MSTATLNEFLFEMPEVKLAKREKSVWEQLGDMAKVMEKEGMLVPRAMAAKMLNLSRARVCQLVQEGTLRTWEFNDIEFVCEKDVASFVSLERQSGRPWKSPSVKESWRIANELIREAK